MKKSLLLVSTLLLTFGCAKEKGAAAPAVRPTKAAPAGERPVALHANTKGPLLEKATKLIDGLYRSECDNLLVPTRLEMAAELDKRQAETAAYKRKNFVADAYRLVPFGPTEAQERKDAAPPVEDKWQETHYGWQDMTATFAEAKKTGDIAKWAELDTDYRDTIDDEIYRVVDGYNYQINHTMMPQLTRLQSELEACRAKADCVAPELSEESLAFIESQLRYKTEYGDVTMDRKKSKKREALEDFADWVKKDLASMTFHVNASVRSDGNGGWILPLDLGAFSPAAEQMSRYFNALWQVDGKKVALEFRSAPDVFRTLLGPDFGGRSSVAFGEKVMTLQPGVRAGTVAHELGHVLGFRDYYFAVWNPVDCSWTQETKHNDLMSNSSGGIVLPEHWATLQENYK